MLAYCIHITSKSDPSYEEVNVISTCSSKTFLATISKGNLLFVPTLHERSKVNIWSEKETLLGDLAHGVFSANSQHGRRNKTFRSLYWKISKGAKGCGRTKIIYVHSWHVFQMGTSGAIYNHWHLSQQHCKGTPWRGNRQQRHPLAVSRINKTFFLFWTADGESVLDVKDINFQNCFLFFCVHIGLHGNIRLVNMQQAMYTIKSVYK